jgi:hypothetical protein
MVLWIALPPHPIRPCSRSAAYETPLLDYVPDHLLNILYLFAHLLDQHLHFDCRSRGLQILRLR